MASNTQHADLLRRAVILTADLDAIAVDGVFINEATWSTSRISTVYSFNFSVVDVADEHGYAEWAVSATRYSAFVHDGDVITRVIGQPFTLHGSTTAAFDGDRISAVRHYWNDTDLIEGLGVARAGQAVR